MREIKFRAWDKEQKKFIGSNYSDNWSNEKNEWWADEGMMMLTGIEDISKKERYVLQQYTGLLDKNGKEIYEGDILNSFYKFEGCNGVYLVKWHDDSCGFYPKKFGTHQQKSVSISMLDLQRCEVIGNIYENPELINNK